MSSIAIKVQNLSKVYKLYDKPIDRLKEALNPFKKTYHKDFYALNDVNFEIKKGETVGIIGKNGAGKSTLLKIITGVLTPSSGHVHVNGRVSSLLELGAGFNPEYTGIENIYLQGTLMGYSKQEVDSKIDEILTFADIGDFVYQPVKSYSSGMFARLAFAVAINVEPDILIVDEALSVGDTFFQVKCHEKMQLLSKNGATILFVTHDQSSVSIYCDQAIWLEKGSIRFEGDVKKALSLYTISNYGTNNNVQESDLNKKINVVDKNNFIDDKCKLNKYTSDIVEIVNFQLYDEKNNMVSRIETDKYLTLDIKYKFLQDIHDLPYITVSFINNKNIRVHIKNTLQEYIFEPKSIIKNETLRYIQKMKIKLSAGEYIISVGLNTVKSEYFKKFDIKNENIIIENRKVLYGIEYGPFYVDRDNGPFSGSYGMCNIDTKTILQMDNK